MPGVPFEMQAMMTENIIPELKKRFHPKSIYHKTILTQGIGESFLAAIIEEWENNLPPAIKLAYLPQPGIVRLRLTGTGDDEAAIRAMVGEQAGKLSAIIPEYIFGEDDDRLEAIIGKLLRKELHPGNSRKLHRRLYCTPAYQHPRKLGLFQRFHHCL